MEEMNQLVEEEEEDATQWVEEEEEEEMNQWVEEEEEDVS